MQGAERVSCANCWFNGLQQGSVGLSAGYCVEHRVVLRRADETTCGRQVRKDLLLETALAQQPKHRALYERMDGVQLIESAAHVNNGVHVSYDSDFIRLDQVGDAVADYGELDSKIESLSILSRIVSLRGDLALFSLARSYTNRCVRLGGRWTSGLHLLQWARFRLANHPVPGIQPDDIRYQTSASLERQVELAQWGVVMLRLLFVSDIGKYAREQGDEVGALADIAEQAAEESGEVGLKSLTGWVRRRGVKLIDAALPRGRYVELSRELHRDREVPEKE